MNAYELMKEFYDLDNEILELVNKKNKKDAAWMDKEIDSKLSRQLEIKHALERINVIHMDTTDKIKEEYIKGNLSDSEMFARMSVALSYEIYEQYKDTIAMSEKELLLNMKEEFMNMGAISDRSWGCDIFK